MKARGIVVGLVLAATVTACGSSGGKTPTAATGFIPPGTNSAPTEAPATEAPTPSVDPTVLALAAWWSSTGRQEVTTLQTDLNALAAAGQNEDSAAIQTAAVQLKADVDLAQAAPTEPGPSGAEWSAALADEGTAAQDYITGAANMDADLIMQGTAALEQGTSHLQVAVALLPKA